MRDYGTDEFFVDLINKSQNNSTQIYPNDVAKLRLAVGKLLIYDGDRYQLFHDRLRVFLVGNNPDPVLSALGEVID